MSSFILASNRLPFQVDSNGAVRACSGGLVSALSGIIEDNQMTWVGAAEPPTKIAHRKLLAQYFKKNRIEPIYVSKLEYSGYYNGYANSSLWPLFHYLYEYCEHDSEWFVHYKSVNQQFAERIASVAAQGATVWIHDYHLMLLPAMLRDLRPDLTIGFFLHTPFPSSEVFRALPERCDLLKGLIGCDLIGFHTYGYLRHFKSSLLRLLGLKSEAGVVQLNDGRTCRLGVFPIGHDHASFQEAVKQSQYTAQRELIREQLGGKKMVLSVGRVDYTKGLPEKLQAIRHFLTHHPVLAKQVSFVFIAVPTRSEIASYQALKEGLMKEVEDINEEFSNGGDPVINVLPQSYAAPELAAYYAEASVCMVTPVIDGMNLVAKEFIACKSASHKSRPGVLVLSEFAGAAEELKHALLVNPFDTQSVSDALVQALRMTDDEIQWRTESLLTRVTLNQATTWAIRYIKELKNAPHPLAEEPTTMGALKPLLKELSVQIKNQQRVSLALDYDGTLREFTQKPDDAVPSKKLLQNLRAIASHPQVDLTIISGRTRAFLDQHFSELPIQLIAEHGAAQRAPGKQWVEHKSISNNRWQKVVMEHLSDATIGTPGSEVEVKKFSLVWHYRQVDPDFADWQASILEGRLRRLATQYPITVQHGHKIIEVCHHQITKGHALYKQLKLEKPSLAICAGDDVTDESMFTLTPPRTTEMKSIKIGAGDTAATHRASIAELADFLHEVSHLCKQPNQLTSESKNR